MSSIVHWRRAGRAAATLLASVAGAQDRSLGPFGAPGGSDFERILPATAHAIARVDAHIGRHVESMRFDYADRLGQWLGSSPWFGGGQRGRRYSFQTPPQDYLESVTVWHDPAGGLEGLQLANRWGRTETYGRTSSSHRATMQLPGHRIVGFHGRAGSVIHALGVKLRPIRHYAPYGTGCATANRTPPQHYGTLLPKTGFTFGWRVRSIGPTFGALLCGQRRNDLDLGFLGLPGCRMLTAPEAVVPFVTDRNGDARVAISLRAAPLSLAGTVVFTQVIVRDPASRQRVPVMVSNGLATEIGL